MLNLQNLREKLGNATAAKQGQFGELLLEQYLISQKISFRRVHKGGADFEISTIGLVDLKTRNALNKSSINFINRYKYKVEGVTYYYIYLCSDKVLLYSDNGISITLIDELGWDKCLELLPNFEIEHRKELDAKQLSFIKDQIKAWVLKEWGLSARVISRSGKKAQDAFDRNGWGPNNFYTPEKLRKKFQLTILLYFDLENIYKVYAYPVGLSDEIDWFPKNKGPNQQGIMIFDPRELNEKFIFSSLDDFKENYLERIF